MLKTKSNFIYCLFLRCNITNQAVRSLSLSPFMARDSISKINKEHRLFLQKCNRLHDLNIPLISRICTATSLDEAQQLADIIVGTSSEVMDSERREELVKVLKFLLSHGCSTHDIKQKCLKYINTSYSSYVKVMLISELDSKIVLLLPLMSLTHATLRLAAKQARDDKLEIVGFSNRISYLSHHLETPQADLIPALTKHSSLLTMRFRRLEQKMNILKNAEINPKYIIKDLWIFNYNEKLLANRISAAEFAGLAIKPWMLRCSDNIFQSLIAKYSETRRILNGDDEITYLAKKLDCSKKYIDFIMEKNKLLKSINVPKLEQILNFLYDKGYTPQEVRLFPRVFSSSIQTLRERLENFQQIKSTLPTMSQLCISSRNFETTLNRKSVK